MLRLEDVTIRQDDFVLHADLSLDAGGVTAVIGPSGGGKSTLLSAIAGFVRLASGHVFWGNQQLDTLAPGTRPISILFQDHNLFPHLTVGQNVGLGLRPTLRLGTSDTHAVSGALAAVGLEGYASRRPGTLSGGQQSRVALARLLVAGRPLVLMDEPFAALGPGQRQDLLALARETLLARGQTLIMVTHDIDDVRSADAVVAVTDGQVHPAVLSDVFLAHPPAAMRDYFRRK